MTLKDLFDNYMEFEKIVNSKSDDKIELNDLNCNPAEVLPLLCECRNQNLKLCDGKSAYEYLNECLKNDRLFSKLPKSRKESDESNFLTNYMNHLDTCYGGYFALRTIISELCNNVFDHSRSENNSPVQSYIFSRIADDSNKLDVGIIDDGISIPGLFEKSNINFSNDCQAIEKAIGVFSTISDSPFERGNGLWTILRLISEGNGGEILIISRYGCLHICGENYKYYLLNEKHKFYGTLVCFRLNKYEIQNIYDLIEFNKPNAFKLGVLHDY